MAAVRRTVRKKKSTAKKQSLLARIDFKAVILSLLVLSFLLFSLGALVYVVFFQTVIVMERGDEPRQFLVQAASNAPLFFGRC